MTARVHLQKLANHHLGGGLKDDGRFFVDFLNVKKDGGTR